MGPNADIRNGTDPSHLIIVARKTSACQRPASGVPGGATAGRTSTIRGSPLSVPDVHATRSLRGTGDAWPAADAAGWNRRCLAAHLWLIRILVSRQLPASPRFRGAREARRGTSDCSRPTAFARSHRSMCRIEEGAGVRRSWGAADRTVGRDGTTATASSVTRSTARLIRLCCPERCRMQAWLAT